MEKYSVWLQIKNGGDFQRRTTVVSFRWRTTYRRKTIVVGFKWRTLVVSHMLQLPMENSGGLLKDTTVVNFK